MNKEKREKIKKILESIEEKWGNNPDKEKRVREMRRKLTRLSAKDLNTVYGVDQILR